jgi:hypothetical protein
MQPVAECADARILKQRFRADLRVYIKATLALETVPLGRDFEKAYRHAVRARDAFEAARELLNKHVAEHGCVPT